MEDAGGSNNEVPLLLASISTGTARGPGKPVANGNWQWGSQQANEPASSVQSISFVETNSVGQQLLLFQPQSYTSVPGRSATDSVSRLEFSLRSRGKGRGSSAAYNGSVGGSRNPARQVFALLRNMQQGLEPSVRSGLFAVFNRHLLPVLAQLALMQHNTASSINERLRTWRVRNPFNRLRRDRQDKESSQAHHASSLRPSRQVSKLLEAGRAKDQQLEPVAAAGLYQQAASLCTTSSEVQTRASLLSLASKSLSDATYAPGTSSSQAVQLNQAAIELASQALELAPEYPPALVARCVSRGRLAMFSDNQTKVRLAAAAADDAKQALALSPQYDLAHHLMGRWHYEMAGLNAMVRTLVRVLYGATLMSGSYQQALVHFRTACELAPDMLIHRVEYGRTLAKLGQTHKAVEELEAALALEVADLNAHNEKLDAQDMIAKLRASGVMHQFLPCLPASPLAPGLPGKGEDQAS